MHLIALIEMDKELNTRGLSRPARNEWGESRRERFSNKIASSPRPSPPSAGREGDGRALQAALESNA